MTLTELAQRIAEEITAGNSIDLIVSATFATNISRLNRVFKADEDGLWIFQEAGEPGQLPRGFLSITDTPLLRIKSIYQTERGLRVHLVEEGKRDAYVMLPVRPGDKFGK